MTSRRLGAGCGRGAGLATGTWSGLSTCGRISCGTGLSAGLLLTWGGRLSTGTWLALLVIRRGIGIFLFATFATAQSERSE